MKKILMTVSVATLAVGLSGCGRDNYQGTYTGFEVPTASNTTTGTTQNGGYNTGYYNMQPSQVSLTLSDNGNVVTGTYTTTSSYGGYQTQYNQYGNQPSQFTASSENSGSLSNVSLLRYMNGQTCFYQGSLASSDHGRQITGSLSSAMSGTSGAWAGVCPTITLNLTRGN
ncbi:MAG: hypothetical protein JST04_08335 [Bdellovibrionales bacterium]|nr:hypothetical protein [Bdellovibrionales bacterium]